jgi:hypothetical protein
MPMNSSAIGKDGVVSELSRVVLSVISWLLAMLVFSLGFAVRGGGAGQGEGPGLLLLFCYWFPVFGYLSLPCWFLGLAGVLMLDNARGWRLWALLAFGVVLGPLTDVAVSFYGHRQFVAAHILYPLWMSAAFSSVAVLIYAVLLRSSLKSRDSA